MSATDAEPEAAAAAGERPAGAPAEAPAEAGAPPVPLVELRRITRRFRMPGHLLDPARPALHALDGVSLEIARGETVCLVGESGSGKTTLGRVLMGLSPPSSGEVWFDGARIDRLGQRRRRPYRTRMQMVFQNPHAALSPRRTVAQTLAEPVRALMPRVRPAALRERVMAVMEATGCDPSWLPRLPHEFSGGQRQRIAIARALVTEPDLVVADEPVSALDIPVRAQILNLLADLRAAHGLTYLVITRDLAVARHMATTVAVMYAGRVMETAPAAELFARARHPYTRLLLASVPRLEGGTFSAMRPPGRPPEPAGRYRGCPFAPRCPLAEERCRRETPQLLPAGAARVACHAVEEGRDAA